MEFYTYVVQQTLCFNCKCREVTEMRRICRWPGTWKTVHLHRGQNKQTVWHIFCKSSYCCAGKQTKVKKKCRKTKQLWYKNLGYKAAPGISRSANGTGLPGTPLLTKEQMESNSHDARRPASKLHLRIAPQR